MQMDRDLSRWLHTAGSFLFLSLSSCAAFGPGHAQGEVLRVGPSGDYDTLTDAVRAAAGDYVDDFPLIRKRLTIRGVGGMAHFRADEEIPNGKGIFITHGDVTLDHVELS